MAKNVYNSPNARTRHLDIVLWETSKEKPFLPGPTTFFYFGHTVWHAGSVCPLPPPPWEPGILTIGPPGNPESLFFKASFHSQCLCSPLLPILCFQSYLVQFSCSVMSDSLQPHESQHVRPPCPSPTPRVYSNSCPSSR